MKKAYHFIRNTYDWIHDILYHVETVKWAQHEEHDNIINFMYEPTPYRVLRKLFARYPINQDDHLIDFGCGKGRVLVMAAKNGCKNLYGIDLSRSLLDIATINLSRCKQKCADLYYKLICMDAKKYVFNPNINKVYLLNPFQLRVFMHLIKSLLSSIEDNPRTITVYYCGIKQSIKDYLDKIGCFKLIGEEEIDNLNISIYCVQ